MNLTDPNTLFRLDGQTALVTGAVAGLGIQIARGLAALGARVAVHGRDPARTQAAADSIDGAEALVCDLNDAEATRREVLGLIARWGRLDILVGNAGIRDRRPMAETSAETFREVLETNLVANFELAQLVGPTMIAAGGGRMVFMSSVGSIRGVASRSTYCASKGGLDALTRALAVELGPHNIRVNALAPGIFATEFNAELVKTAGILEAVKRIPLRRYAQPEELIGPALFLATEASSFITGQVLVVDGGRAISSS